MGEALTTADLDQAVSASQRAHDPYGGGFRDGNGADVAPPDRVEYEFGARRGWLAVVFHDGDAYVRFDGDKGDTLVKWRSLCKVPAWADDPGAAAGCPFGKAARGATPTVAGGGPAEEGYPAQAGRAGDAGQDASPLRSALVGRIRKVAADRGMGATGVAASLGIAEPEAADLLSGPASGFGAERLVAMLNGLSVDVHVTFREVGEYRVGTTTFGFDPSGDAVSKAGGESAGANHDAPGA